MRLFKRRAVLTVDQVRIEGLRVQFSVTKSVTGEPATAEITVYNLSPATRAAIKRKWATVLLEAGYQEGLERVFSGDARNTFHQRAGPDWQTRLQCGDGERALTESTAALSFGAGTTKLDAAEQIARTMGVGLGNLVPMLQSRNWVGAAKAFAGGFVAMGRSSDELRKVLASAGLKYAVMDGELRVFEEGASSEPGTLVIGPSSGLVGSPELGELNVVKFKTLLIPGIRPGRRVLLDTASFKGAYQVQRVVHTGDTDGGEWTTDCEALPQ